jgi:hypothetical protein
MELARSNTWLLVAAAALALAASAGSARAEKELSTGLRAFRPEADTYVSADRPRTNFGRSRSLRADGSPRATTYLRFRLITLKGEITSVTLLLHAQRGARTSYEVRRVNRDGWREGRLTFENAPRLSLRYASSKPVRRGAWSAVDVTSFVPEDSGPVSLAITTRSALGVVFESRESNQGPRLVVRTRNDKQGGKEPPQLPF